MAARRLNFYGWKGIKIQNGMNREAILTPRTLVLTRSSKRPKSVALKFHAVHDRDNNLLRWKAFLVGAVSGSCVVRLYQIDPATFSESLIYTSPSVVPANGAFIGAILETSVSPVEYIGEVDFAFDVTVTRGKSVISDRFYLNSLGIFDFADRIKKRVQFLEIAKRDFGQ